MNTDAGVAYAPSSRLVRRAPRCSRRPAGRHHGLLTARLTRSMGLGHAAKMAQSSRARVRAAANPRQRGPGLSDKLSSRRLGRCDRCGALAGIRSDGRQSSHLPNRRRRRRRGRSAVARGRRADRGLAGPICGALPTRSDRAQRMPDMHPPHALSDGRLAALGATRGSTTGC